MFKGPHLFLVDLPSFGDTGGVTERISSFTNVSKEAEEQRTERMQDETSALQLANKQKSFCIVVRKGGPVSVAQLCYLSETLGEQGQNSVSKPYDLQWTFSFIG